MSTPAAEFGLGIQGDKPAGEYGRLAAIAERYDFDVVSVFSDLMFSPPIFPLLEMAASTERVRLGAACWNPYSMHPYEIAGQLAALDLASHGRAYFGLARGTWLGDVGLAQPSPLGYLAEVIEYVYSLLSADGHGFEGRHFTLAPGVVPRFPIERARPPLLMGVWGPKASALAGAIADEIKIGGTANPAMVAVMRDRLAAGETKAGRDVGDTRIVMGAVTVVDLDGVAARAKARREVAMYLAVVAEFDPTVEIPSDLLDRVKLLVADGDHDAAGRLIPDDLLDLFAFSGSPEQVAAQAQRLIDAGVHRIDFGTPQGLTDDRGIEVLGEYVLPQLQPARSTVAL